MVDDVRNPKQAENAGGTGTQRSAADMTQAALREVESAASAIQADVGTASARTDPFKLPSFSPTTSEGGGATPIGLLNDVELKVTVELGRTIMYVEDVLRLNDSSVIELDKAAGDPVDIYVNDRHVARGEVLVLNENFCVRISELVQPGPVENET